MSDINYPITVYFFTDFGVREFTYTDPPSPREVHTIEKDAEFGDRLFDSEIQTCQYLSRISALNAWKASLESKLEAAQSSFKRLQNTYKECLLEIQLANNNYEA